MPVAVAGLCHILSVTVPWTGNGFTQFATKRDGVCVISKRDGVCNPAAYVLCSPQRQNQGTERYGRDYKSRPALLQIPSGEARRGLQPRRLRFVQPPKPEARHETLRTGLQIPSGTEGTKRYGRDCKSRPAPFHNNLTGKGDDGFADDQYQYSGRAT